MAFHLGSLGFLTPFKFDTYKSQVTQIIEGTECVWDTTPHTHTHTSNTFLGTMFKLYHPKCLKCLSESLSRVFVYRQRRYCPAKPLEGTSAERELGEEGQSGRQGDHPDQRGHGQQPQGGALSGTSAKRQDWKCFSMTEYPTLIFTLHAKRFHIRLLENLKSWLALWWKREVIWLFVTSYFDFWFYSLSNIPSPLSVLHILSLLLRHHFY